MKHYAESLSARSPTSGFRDPRAQWINVSVQSLLSYQSVEGGGGSGVGIQRMGRIRGLEWSGRGPGPPLDRWRREGRQQLLSTYYVSELA